MPKPAVSKKATTKVASATSTKATKAAEEEAIIDAVSSGEETTLASRGEPTLAVGAFMGGSSSFSLEDIDIPRANVIQRSSEIDGDPGSLVLNREFTIVEPDGSLDVIVLSHKKGWREDIPYEENEMPRMVYTEAERAKLSQDSDYSVIEFADIAFLFPQTEGTPDEAYPFPIGNTNYALGQLNVAKVAYRQTFKRLATFAQFNRQTPVCGVYWRFNVTTNTAGRNSYFAPNLVVQAGKKVPKEVIDFIQGLG